MFNQLWVDQLLFITNEVLYLYDVETELYWCATRFYDPEIGRFVSPDALEYLEPNKINGLNLYQYCYNNPINYYGPNGTEPLTLTTLAIYGLYTLLAVATATTAAYAFSIPQMSLLPGLEVVWIILTTI